MREVAQLAGVAQVNGFFGFSRQVVNNDPGLFLRGTSASCVERANRELQYVGCPTCLRR